MTDFKQHHKPIEIGFVIATELRYWRSEGHSEEIACGSFHAISKSWINSSSASFTGAFSSDDEYFYTRQGKRDLKQISQSIPSII
ncbi:MAG: hypothetical protein F4X56_00865 [Gammaproteobacteria bacterium]|nr:hypothetical protein [Gammaproteobacteria bacterium]MYC24451.1 hypothetical protein [Gammaproteobacteria bacterium]